MVPNPNTYAVLGRIFLVLVVIGLFPREGRAQLISPGKLIEAHADFDRLGACTNCHTLGKRSVDQTLCLDCHRPLRNRIEAGLGFHAELKDDGCASCHKDHFGRDFDPVRFDTTAFKHDTFGYELKLSHADVTCSGCHIAANITAPDVRVYKGEHDRLGETYLGLDRQCASCHESESRHGNQFQDRTCQTCHDEGRWKDAPGFNHDKTDYPLTGLHRGVTCVQCHAPSRPVESTEPVDYRAIESGACSSCHADVHQSRMGSNCVQCHATNGWSNLTSNRFEKGFDHDRTGFGLMGAHQTTDCSNCHSPGKRLRDITLRFSKTSSRKTYPKPDAGSCTSCHRDVHVAEFSDEARNLSCLSCHGQETWNPSTFDVFRHAEESKFLLTGAHLGVVCSKCHQAESGQRTVVRFNVEDATCERCHKDVNPHGVELQAINGEIASCASCHGTTSWKSSDLNYDHARTKFPLDGRHTVVSCDACHRNSETKQIVLTGLDTTCRGCHSDKDPHLDQFAGSACSDCHDSRSFRMETFDHSRARFLLDSAHEHVACASCHPSELSASGVAHIRFKPLGIACADCHGDRNE